MKKRNLVIANWKMNPLTLAEAKNIFGATRLVVKALKNTDVIVCPPNVYLQYLSKLDYPKNLFFGSQNIATEQKGALTGEVSASMIKNLDLNFTLIGHSERRAMGETNEIVRKKLEAAFNNGLTPILCIGEQVRDKDGTHLEFIKSQIKECLTGIQKKNLVGLMVAYEPVWAIGKSYQDAMDATDVHETTLFIKKVAGEFFGKDIADSFRILYGAAVEPENTPILFSQGNIDGLLVGHASLVPAQFTAILKAADGKK